jgi:hypothetical protein
VHQHSFAQQGPLIGELCDSVLLLI